MFSWTRAAVTNISNPSKSGSTATIYDTLINTSSSLVRVLYVFTLTAANGCSNNDTLVRIVNPTPKLSSPKNDTVCSGAPKEYSITTTPLLGVTYTWTRAAVAGISNPAKSGSTATIRDTLINTTSLPITVLYVFTLTANGCSNNDTLTRIVNPLPKLSSPKSDTVCTGVPITYTATSTGSGTTVIWRRIADPYISSGRTKNGSGTTPITITDTLSIMSASLTSPIAVIYVFELTENSCPTNNDTLIRIVKPVAIQTARGGLKLDTVCSGIAKPRVTQFNITPDTFRWTRAAVPNILESASSGSDSINEILTNISNSAITVDYEITTTINGCYSRDVYERIVFPPVVFTSPDTCESASICSGFAAIYNLTSDPSAKYTWTRAAVNGILEPASSGNDDINEVLTNTTDHPITVTYIVTATNSVDCSYSKPVTVVVKPKKTPSITIKVKTD
jgi:hypothetical protein